MTLRQIATRLGGTYHDANDRNVPTKLIEDISGLLPIKEDAAAGRRELAIAATGVGGTLVAIVPLALALFGTAWKPGRRTSSTPAAQTATASASTKSNSLEGAAHA
jgi:Ca-activated chloride channel family protein